MARRFILSCLLAALLSKGYAKDGNPASRVQIDRFVQPASITIDTVPELKKIPETKTDSVSKSSAIKEVPKSKKQTAPVAVPVKVNVKPIKIVKPKIIKPVIKIN